MLHVGLTGGIATGKSTVLNLFKEKGAQVLDFDQITRFVQEPGRPAWKALIGHFGRDILNDDGTLNRKKLADVVFGDKEKLSRLNEIVHPFIFEEWERRLAPFREDGCQNIVISDMPLLFEIRAQRYFDCIIVVYAAREKQMERLMERNGCSRDDALRRLDAQLPIDSKLPLADYVIDNSASLEKTRERVDAVWTQLKGRLR